MTNNKHNMKFGTSNRQPLSTLITGVLLCIAATSFTQSASAQSLCCDKTAQGGCVTPMPARPSPTRGGDVGRYGEFHKRIDKLDTGNCANAYHLHKAQAWLNLSRDLHYEGDGSTATNAAYDEAEKLIKALEEGKTPSLDTAMIQNASKLRADLWDITTARKATPALLSSAAREVAYCEVALVRAGYAQANLGGNARVNPLLGMAQDICAAAKDKPTCPVPPPAPVVQAPAPAPVVVAPPPPPQPAPPVVVAPTAIPAPMPAAPAPKPKRRVKQDRN
jgi:hypothetical protein